MIQRCNFELKYDKLLSSFDFNFNLRRCMQDERDSAVNEVQTELGVLQQERMKLNSQARTFAARLDRIDDLAGGGGGGGGGDEEYLRSQLEAGPGEYCPPRHQPLVEPSSLELKKGTL